MYLEYFYWQYFSAPGWLLKLFRNLHIVLLRAFSVSIMLRTLFAHWHKDAVRYNQGSLGGFAKAWAWNMISRGIGFLIRLSVLLFWAVSALLLTAFFTAAFLFFLIWPLLALISLFTGAILLFL